MRKAIGVLVILASSFISVFGQTREACQAQLNHFTPTEDLLAPEIKWPPDPKNHPSPATRFLFSEDGTEVYAGGFRPMDGYVGSFCENINAQVGITVIYQSEAARQSAITLLRKINAPDWLAFADPAPGGGAPVTNLKYAQIFFQPESAIAGTPGAGKWHIVMMEFYQPVQCDHVFDNYKYNGLQNLIASERPSNPDIAGSGPWRGWTLDDYAFCFKGLQAMQQWLKQCDVLFPKR